MRSGPEEQGRAGQGSRAGEGRAMQLAGSWWAQRQSGSPPFGFGSLGGRAKQTGLEGKGRAGQDRKERSSVCRIGGASEQL